MLKKLSVGLIILTIALGSGGCVKQPPQNETVKSEYLTPIPEGTPLGEANLKLSDQIMAQKDVQGTQIYEEQGITYGDITFKGGADKAYVNQLLKELLVQMKTNYPGKPVTVQGLSDGQVIDSINYKP